jgi:hypothetical protein
MRLLICGAWLAFVAIKWLLVVGRWHLVVGEGRRVDWQLFEGLNRRTVENLMFWLSCAALVVVAGYYVLLPLFRESRGSLDFDLLAETELDRLQDRKTVIYRNLKDLEFEYKMGRLSERDFEQLGAGYKNEAAAILQKLERLDAAEHLDGRIEREIASRKAALFGSGSKNARESSRCPSCGAEIISGKKYCGDCGHQL